jgi:uncharacterized ferritin-like protein (DUF455 family)
MEDIMKLTRTFAESNNIKNSKRDLSAFAYSLRRLIDFEASWVAHFSDFDDKITVGLAIGLDAVALDPVNKRLEEQSGGIAPYQTSVSADVERFDMFAHETDRSIIRKFIGLTTGDISVRGHNLLQKLDPLYDQPSILAVKGAIEVLECKISLLKERGWNVRRQFISGHAHSSDVVTLNEKSIKPALLDVPMRPDILQQNDQSILNAPSAQLIESPEGIKRLLHFIYADVEVVATEICARNIAQFGQCMPTQFTLDMARQCSDEARHAIMADKALAAHGGQLGDFTYTNHVWKAYMKGQTIGERLAVEQIISEGGGLDTSAAAIEIFRNKGMTDLLKYYEFLQADEIIHCAFGNRWLNYLVQGDAGEYENVIDSSLRRANLTLTGRTPVNVEARRAAEYPEWFIQNRLLTPAPTK